MVIRLQRRSGADACLQKRRLSGSLFVWNFGGNLNGAFGSHNGWGNNHSDERESNQGIVHINQLIPSSAVPELRCFDAGNCSAAGLFKHDRREEGFLK